MFHSKTVFVLGAGASEEVNLPVGSDLTKAIAKLLRFELGPFRHIDSGDPKFLEALFRIVDGPPPWGKGDIIDCAQDVAEAMEMAISIDTYLQTHDDNEVIKTLGKLAIARAILIAERKSLLAPESEKPFSLGKVADTWFVSLAQLLFSGVPVVEADKVFDNVSFIVFNYDRCLEVFLSRSLQVYFRMSADRAIDLVKKANIIHPYGSIGPVLTLRNGSYSVRRRAKSRRLPRVSRFFRNELTRVKTTKKWWPSCLRS